MLIAQPFLIRRRRFDLHRNLGKFSLILVPLFLVAIVLLAHSRIKGLEGTAYTSLTLIDPVVVRIVQQGGQRDAVINCRYPRKSDLCGMMKRPVE